METDRMRDLEARWLSNPATVVRHAADAPVYVSLRREGFALTLSDCRRTIDKLKRIARQERALHDWFAHLRNRPKDA